MQLKPLTQEIQIHVEAPVYPSEDFNKVKEAVEKLLLEIKVELVSSKPFHVRGSSSDGKCLSKIYNQIRSRATLGVARRLLIGNASETSTWIFFNKQAAFMGVVSMCEEESESPLGPIQVSFTAKNIQEFIDWLAPRI